MWRTVKDSKKIIAVKTDGQESKSPWNLGAAGHVMPEGTFPRAKLERKTSPMRFVGADGEQIRDLGAKSVPIHDKRRNSKMHNIQKCECCQTSQKVVRAGKIVVLDEKNPHIRNIRDGTTIKMNVNHGVYTMDMWICLDETGPIFSWQGQ